MVEGAALEMLFKGNFNEGSNPSLSVYRASSKLKVNCDCYLNCDCAAQAVIGPSRFLNFNCCQIDLGWNYRIYDFITSELKTLYDTIRILSFRLKKRLNN